MSYKYSRGSTVQGDIKAADDTQRDTLIDFGEDQIDFQTSGSVRLTIQNTETTVNTPLTVSGEISAAGMVQPLNTITGATGEVDHDCSISQMFYHSNIAGNFTPNFTQLDLSNSEITSISIILDQGGTAYLPDAYKINSTASSLYWEGSAMPTGSANKVDTVDLKILRVSDSYNTFARFHNTIEISSEGGGVSIPNNALMFLDASDANSYGGSGTTWTDLSGQNNHGTLVNSPTYNSTDKLFEFTGNSSQHITAPSGFADFSNGTTFFVVADLGVGSNWERFLDFSVGGQTNDAFNFGRKQTGTSLSMQFYHVEEGNANKSLESNQISNNTLASYAVTTDGTSAKIYKNGILVDTISFAATLSNVTRTQNYIGRSRAGGNAYYEGEMAVVGIFNRDLTAGEISELHSFYNGIYNL